MCFEENCLPLCDQWSHINDPYCKDNRLGIYSAPKKLGPSGERVAAPPCSVGDTYIAGGGDNLLSWVLGLFGVTIKTELV